MSSFLIITDSKRTENKDNSEGLSTSTDKVYEFLEEQLKAIGYTTISKKFAFETPLPILSEIEDTSIDYIIIDVPKRIKLNELFNKIVIKKEYLKDYALSKNITQTIHEKKVKLPYIILFTEKKSINITPQDIPVFIEDIILKTYDLNLILAKLAILVKRHSIENFNKYKTDKLIRIFNNSNIIIIELDKDFHIKFINKKGLYIFNETYESVENKIFFNMVTKDTEYRNSLRYIFNYHLQNEKKRFSFESLLINKKGDKLMINWLVEVSCKNSKIEDFILVGYEITKQVKIGEEFEKFAYSLMAQNRKLNEELQSSKASAELLEQDMRLAKKIQHGILPKHFPQTSGAKISAIYIPMDAVGGDFYDAFSFDKSFGIIISDVVGHGIPAALVTSMTKVLSYNYSRRIFSPKDFSEKINEDFQKLLIAGNFLTMFVAHYDYLNRLLKYSSCGHIPQIFCRKDTGDFILLNSTGPLMGIIPKSVYEERYIENVRPGDRLLMFTDGITEAKNQNRDMFGIKRLLQTIKKHYHKDIQEFKESIVSDIAEFSTGTKVEDDVSLVVIEFTD